MSKGGGCQPERHVYHSASFSQVEAWKVGELIIYHQWIKIKLFLQFYFFTAKKQAGEAYDFPGFVSVRDFRTAYGVAVFSKTAVGLLTF